MTPLLYALVPQTAVTALSDLQLCVTSPGTVDAPLFTNLYLLRDDKASRTGLMMPGGQAYRFGGAAGRAANRHTGRPVDRAVPSD
jgi:hypothetical protein